MEFKAFDNNDWMAWAGADEGPNGEDPMIAECGNFIVIADNNGIGIYEYLGDPDNPHGQREYYINNENAYDVNLTMARGLTEEQLRDPEALARLGFERGPDDMWGDQDHA